MTARCLEHHHHGEVVGGGAGLIGLDVDLLGVVLDLSLAAVVADGAVAVGEYTVLLHLEIGRHEHVVDAAVGVAIGGKAVEGAVEGIAQPSRLEGVAQGTAFGKSPVGAVGLVYVEVAGENDRQPLAQRPHFLLHEVGALDAGLLADVVHVQVEEEELERALLILEVTPRADAGQDGIPAHTGGVGRLGEPEVAVVEQLETAGAVEDGGMFAPLSTVVTAHTDVVEARQAVLQRIELMLEPLLRAEEVEVVEPDEVGHDYTALAPAVALS